MPACAIPYSTYRHLPHQQITINNYVNCPSNFAFAHSFVYSTCRFLRNSLCGKGLLTYMGDLATLVLLEGGLIMQFVIIPNNSAPMKGGLIIQRVHILRCLD